MTSYSLVSFLIFLKNKCTDNSSSKVHLFTKFKLRAKWNTLASASMMEKERGGFSNKADFLHMCSFWVVFVLRSLLVLWLSPGKKRVSWRWGNRIQAVPLTRHLIPHQGATGQARRCSHCGSTIAECRQSSFNTRFIFVYVFNIHRVLENLS